MVDHSGRIGREIIQSPTKSYILKSTKILTDSLLIEILDKLLIF